MIIFLISLIALGLTVFLYFKTLALAPLRIIAIIIIYILISGFILSYRVDKKRNPPVLLIDRSASMAKYADDMNETLNQITFDHRRFYFSETLMIDTLNIPPASNRYTDIGQALIKVYTKEPSFVMLFSDGNHNFGYFPFSDVREFNIPVYTVGIGSEKIQDIAVTDIVSPAYVFIDDSIKIDVVVESQGFTEGSAQVTLRYDDKELKKAIQLSDEMTKTNIEFRLHINRPQQSKIIIDVAHQPGESVHDNNQTEFSLKVFEKRIKVVYYTDHLSFNSKFLIRELLKDDYIDLDPVARIYDNSLHHLIDNKPISAIRGLGDIDVLILDNIDIRYLPWQNIEDMVKKGMGLLCIGSIQGQTPAWNEILPINTTGTVVKGKFSLDINELFSCLVPGDNYPPFSAINRVLGIADQAVVIAHAMNIPIIAYHDYGSGVVFQINAVDIGIWHFVQLGLKQKNIINQLVCDIIRFLSPLGKNKRLYLKTLYNTYNIGEVISLQLQSYDQNYKLTSGGDFYFEYNGTKIPFFETSRGIYGASFVPNKPGKVTVKASGKLKDEVLDSNVLELAVTSTNIEADKGLNSHFLKTLSSETGGEYCKIEQINDFKPPLEKSVAQTVKIEFDSPLSYILILVLITVDWIIRRRRGII